MAVLTKAGTGPDAVYTWQADGANLTLRVDAFTKSLFVGKEQDPLKLPQFVAAELVPLIQGYVTNGVLP